MQEPFAPLGGTELSDTELVVRIRAAARTGGRAVAGQRGAAVPDGAGKEALDEFHRRYYAAVLAYARAFCGSSQAAADLAAEAISGVLHSPDPGADPDTDWQGSLMAAVRHVAAAWHQGSRRTELRDDFAPWLAGRHPGEGSDPAGTGQESTAGSERSASVRPVGLSPSDGPRKARGSWPAPARIALLAVAVTVVAGVALSVGPLLGPTRDHASGTSPGRVGLSSAPTPDESPTASPGKSATASRSASGSPSARHTPASKQPSSRPSKPARRSPSAPRGPKGKPRPARTTALSARPWASSQNAWAPVGQNRSVDGRPLTIAGTGYPEGLGAHANSEITYQLGGTCSALGVDVGIDDEVGANGSVVFQIYRDGTKVADSGLMTVGQPAKHLTADLTGGSELRLVVTDGGNGNNSDHADWGGPLITCR
ncbi:NPCBM/NEW2 domain-containing protein [Streptomyces sioyaensis]|uniref:NPCBM/NEW2 domain-containing protein n=1 Tax=Streptomyces sioyaensis TaxID=67364 RepID=UPI001F2216C9|nr:NPCBM/NEW2 domain-containing protein [Streptomyces sioyaensis]MCF3175046.1 NPCBM/NEW2 domain-containing protein [Streptomyces sioyaensis]